MNNSTKSFFIKAEALAIAAVIAVSALAMSGCQKNIDETPNPVEPTAPVVTEPDPEITTPPTEASEDTTPTVVTEPDPEPLEKYLSYYEQNSDFVGWIQIPTIAHSNGQLYVDYPVVQTKDNSTYLDIDFNKKSSKGGTIYADYKVPITAKSHADNITLYGHSMANGTFFRKVLDYKSGVDFVKKHYIINFDTRWEENQYVVVACFLIGIYEWQDNEPLFEYYKCRNFDTEEDYNYFYENIMHRSYYLSDIECHYGDEFLTLSTCAYDFDDSRFVVVARKVRPGEDISGYASTYAKNANRHRPSILKS